MRFIHSADWQIGKVFKQFGAKEEALRQARLGAIERLGTHAKSNGVHHVVVAGDVYDNEAPNPHTLRAPIERMKRFADVHGWLLGKLPNTARPSSNRHHPFSSATSRQISLFRNGNRPQPDSSGLLY